MCEIQEEYENEHARRRFIAHGSVGASTIRRQGHPGVAHIRNALADIDVSGLQTIDGCAEFVAWLDVHTNALANEFLNAPGRVNWGAARKVLNIHIFSLSRDYLMRRILSLDNIKKCFEVPLDDKSAQFIYDKATEEEKISINTPKQFTIIRLQTVMSKNYQNIADNVAERIGTIRVHLEFCAFVA